MRLNVSPSDFWKLTPYEYWLLYDEYCIINCIGDKEPDVDVKRLKKLFDLPEAKPSLAKKVRNGNRN